MIPVLDRRPPRPAVKPEGARARRAARRAARDVEPVEAPRVPTRRAARLGSLMLDPLVVPLLCGTLAALFSQVMTLRPALVKSMADQLAVSLADVGLGWLPIAAAIGLSLECTGLACMRYARRARLNDDSPTVYVLGTWTVTLTAAVINWHHWTPAWNRPTLLGFVFAGLSILPVAGWELREHRAFRDRKRDWLKASTGWRPEAVPPRPQFGLVRWIRFPGETFTAWSLAVRYRIPTSAEALGRAREVRAGRWAGVGFLAWLQVCVLAVLAGPASPFGLAWTSAPGPRTPADPAADRTPDPAEAVEDRTPDPAEDRTPDLDPAAEADLGELTGPRTLALDAAPADRTPDPAEGRTLALAPAPAEDRTPDPAPADRTPDPAEGRTLALVPALADRTPAPAAVVEPDDQGPRTEQFPALVGDQVPDDDDEVFAALVTVGVEVYREMVAAGQRVNQKSFKTAVRRRGATIPNNHVSALWATVRERCALTTAGK